MTKKYDITIKSENTDFSMTTINNYHSAEQFARRFYHEDINLYESVFIILLNRNNTTIGYAKISQGGISGSVVEGKIICKYAVDVLASGVILVHNHPSGNTNPSENDRRITKQLKQQLNLFDVNFIDHIILTDKECYSFADSGIIN